MSKKKIILITCIVLGIISVLGIKTVENFRNVEKSSESSISNKNRTTLYEENSVEEEINDLEGVKKKYKVDLAIETDNQDDLNNNKNKNSIVPKGENSKSSQSKKTEKKELSDYEVSDSSGQNDEQEVNIEDDNPKERDDERNTVLSVENKSVEEQEETIKTANETDGDAVPEIDLEAEERKARLETTNPLIYIEDITATSNSEKVMVSLKIKNNPGVLGMVVSIYFDEKAVCLLKVKNGDAVDSVLSLTAANVLKSGCNFVWDGQSLTKKDINDGELMEMEFSLVPGVEKGKYPIKIICEPEDAVDADLQPINFEIIDGVIKVK